MDELQLRQASVKELLQDYAAPLALNAKEPQATDEILRAFKLRLEERGVPLYAEEVLMGITLIESLLDLSEDNSVEQLQGAMLTMLMALLTETQDRWTARDKDFFTD